MGQIANIVQRLEIRKMESDGWSAIWCPVCFHCVISRDGTGRNRQSVNIQEGNDACGLSLAHGSINDAIVAFRQLL